MKLPDDNDALAQEENSMFNPNLLKPTDIPAEFMEDKNIEKHVDSAIATPKKQKKSMKTLTKLKMQLESNKEAAKKKHKKSTARSIITENIGTTNVLKGADILLRSANKKNKNKGQTEKRYIYII